MKVAIDALYYILYNQFVNKKTYAGKKQVYHAGKGQAGGGVKKQWDGESVQALRRHLGLTQKELSEQLGTRQQTISEWETGAYRPRGASATLLSFIAEQARFKYQAGPPEKKS